jgi:hypothetical protein
MPQHHMGLALCVPLSMPTSQRRAVSSLLRRMPSSRANTSATRSGEQVHCSSRSRAMATRATSSRRSQTTKARMAPLAVVTISTGMRQSSSQPGQVRVSAGVPLTSRPSALSRANAAGPFGQLALGEQRHLAGRRRKAVEHGGQHIGLIHKVGAGDTALSVSRRALGRLFRLDARSCQHRAQLHADLVVLERAGIRPRDHLNGTVLAGAVASSFTEAVRPTWLI